MIYRNNCNNNRKNEFCKIENINAKCIQFITGPTGPCGEMGPTGAKGETGATGATGAKGESEKIAVGNVATVNFDEKAEIVDRYLADMHYLDFSIPCGCTGAKGDKGEKGDPGEKGEKGEKGDPGEKGEQGIQGLQGEKGDPGEKGEQGLRGEQGLQGEKGEKGDKGDPGEKGDMGVISNQNATILSMAGQDITNGDPLLLSTILTNNGLVLGGTFITVPSTGTYFVAYYVNRADSGAGTDYVALAIDDQINSYTARPLNDASTSSGQFVLNLTEGNTLSLVPVVINAKKIVGNGGPSATLTVIKLS